MKRMLTLLLILGLTAMGCASTGRYNTQRGAAIGAGLGALAGQAIGNNTESTLIGTGVGTLLGTIVGNGLDQQADEYRSREGAHGYPDNSYYGEYDRGEYYGEYGRGEYYGEYGRGEARGYRQPPPGQWVRVPGHWQGRRWVPPHDVWMPVDPR